MVNAFYILQALLSLVTLFVAAMVAYRAFRGYRIAGNLNLLLLAVGFALLCVYFLFYSIGFAGLAARPPAPRTVLRYFTLDFLEVIAYLFVMLAYVVKPRSEEIATAVAALALLQFSFELFILVLLLVVVISVWSSYRSKPSAPTALVLASFSLLLVLHIMSALLLFSPALAAAGSLYYDVMQMLSFALLFMAIGHRPGKGNQRGTAESA